MNRTLRRSAAPLAASLVVLCLGASAGPNGEPASAVAQAPKPKFEPREKFEAEPDNPFSVTLPPVGPLLRYALVGPRGTFQLCGVHGEASFLWPIAGRAPQFYRQPMVYETADADGLVYRLSGRFCRVWFKLATRPDADGKHAMWIRNGDRPWAAYQSAIAAPYAE